LTCDRTEFVGRNRTLAQPAAMGRQRLRGKTGINIDPCAALQVSMDLAPGEEREIAFTLGAGRDDGEARNLIQRFRNLDAAAKPSKMCGDSGITRSARCMLNRPTRR
jgi:cellobiose phosphorylase